MRANRKKKQKQYWINLSERAQYYGDVSSDILFGDLSECSLPSIYKIELKYYLLWSEIIYLM